VRVELSFENTPRVKGLSDLLGNPPLGSLNLNREQDPKRGQKIRSSSLQAHLDTAREKVEVIIGFSISTMLGAQAEPKG
jgi:hypothetical protein